ncbi:MAG: GTPase [Candidatus Micrarchaeia archaeon]
MEDEELEKKLEELKEEYSNTKYNKATDKHLGLLRAKIAKINRALKSRKRKHGVGFSVKKSGDATVALVGFPNSGKSSLLKALTGVDSKIANYAFTTVNLIPGMLEYKGAKIQIFDIPGLIEGAHEGKGEGSKVASAIRVADLLLIILDATDYAKLDTLIKELYLLGIRIGSPKLKIEEEASGGIMIVSNGHAVPDEKEIKEVLEGFGIYNANIVFLENSTLGDIIEAASGSIYIDAIIVLNKVDLLSDYNSIARIIEEKNKIKVVPISALNEFNLEKLKEEIFLSLKLIRVYLKPKSSEDKGELMILKEGSTVLDAARKIHSEVANTMKFAYITGPSAKFRNQRVGKGHILKDGDFITIVEK